MDLTCQDVKLLLLYLCYIELCIVQLFIASNDPRVIGSIEALYAAIVFLNSLKFASRESRCLAASIPRGTLRYLQTVLYSHCREKTNDHFTASREVWNIYHTLDHSLNVFQAKQVKLHSNVLKILLFMLYTHSITIIYSDL